MSDCAVVCVDVGSTYTKAALVDLGHGSLVARAERPTTYTTDVLEGLDGCVADLADVDARARGAAVLACSSAGGGLRIAVVGNEALVTAEAGRRVALSSGGRVVHVAAAADGLSRDDVTGSRPDVVLLVGGTDGGNAAVLLRCADALAGVSVPVVVAGNTDAAEEVAARLRAGGTPYVATGNVMPRIGALAPEPARRAVREVFLSHVIGGKHLSAGHRFEALVRGATPDVVLTAVELLAELHEEVVVVDVGGATTDVYSAVAPPERSEEGLGEDVVGRAPVSRTVEGDLGMRWSAVDTVAAAADAGYLDPPSEEAARGGAEARRAEPGFLPTSAVEQELDLRLAAWAAGIALRRHAGRARVVVDEGDGGRVVERSGVDLREVRLLVGSGGALRHAPEAAARLLDHVSTAGGWQVPEDARVVVDHDYVLFAAGLLAERHRDAATALLRSLG